MLSHMLTCLLSSKLNINPWSMIRMALEWVTSTTRWSAGSVFDISISHWFTAPNRRRRTGVDSAPYAYHGSSSTNDSSKA